MNAKQSQLDLALTYAKSFTLGDIVIRDRAITKLAEVLTAKSDDGSIDGTARMRFDTLIGLHTNTVDVLSDIRELDTAPKGTLEPIEGMAGFAEPLKETTHDELDKLADAHVPGEPPEWLDQDARDHRTDFPDLAKSFDGRTAAKAGVRVPSRELGLFEKPPTDTTRIFDVVEAARANLKRARAVITGTDKPLFIGSSGGGMPLDGARVVNEKAAVEEHRLTERKRTTNPWDTPIPVASKGIPEAKVTCVRRYPAGAVLCHYDSEKDEGRNVVIGELVLDYFRDLAEQRARRLKTSSATEVSSAYAQAMQIVTLLTIERARGDF